MPYVLNQRASLHTQFIGHTLDRHHQVIVVQEYCRLGETVESNERYVLVHCPAVQFVSTSAIEMFE